MGQRSYFTDRGNDFMKDLLSQRINIIRIPGIQNEDHKELKRFLNLIGEKYELSELILR